MERWLEFTLITVLMIFWATVQELKKSTIWRCFGQFGCSVYILLMCTFKGLLYYVKGRKSRHPRTGKQGCVNALRHTVQVLFVDLSAQGNPCFNILSCLECCLQGCYKCLGLNAMSATPHETVLIHFFFFFCFFSFIAAGETTRGRTEPQPQASTPIPHTP